MRVRDVGHCRYVACAATLSNRMLIAVPLTATSISKKKEFLILTNCTFNRLVKGNLSVMVPEL